MNREDLRILVVDEDEKKAQDTAGKLREQGYTLVRDSTNPIKVVLEGNHYDVAIIHLSKDHLAENTSLSEYMRNRFPNIFIIGSTSQKADYRQDFFANKWYDRVINRPLILLDEEFSSELDRIIQGHFETEEVLAR